MITTEIEDNANKVEFDDIEKHFGLNVKKQTTSAVKPGLK